MSRRALLFAVIVASCLGGAGAYVRYAAQRGSPVALVPQPPAGSGQTALLDPTPLLAPGDVPPAGPLLVFRRTSLDQYNGALGLAPVADPASARFMLALRCERVHMAAGRGVCLTADRGIFTTYGAVLFDRTFNPVAELPLVGAPSRLQVAPDGTLAATTVFVTGHSYATVGFSTRTSIIDLDTRRWLVEDLETFAVRRRDQTLRAADFNFWGVTFMPGARRFYATLGTGGETLLVTGDVDARAVEVIEENVECPSLSPDGRRVAFKHRDGGLTAPITWRLWVLDLETRQRHRLAETRSVDDQVQWLDDERVLYALSGGAKRAAIMDQWVVPADGGGEPRLFVSQAYSAAVVRGDPDRASAVPRGQGTGVPE
ncbi:MAG: TolB family protein [Gammaproteobacteria bacterium]